LKALDYKTLMDHKPKERAGVRLKNSRDVSAYFRFQVSGVSKQMTEGRKQRSDRVIYLAIFYHLPSTRAVRP
jgi:hypothetical protein